MDDTLPGTQLTFDYSLMPRDARAIVVAATHEIKDRIGRAAQNIFEIGTRLNTVKEHLPHGAFGDWLQAEFGWNERTAQRMMAVARTFKSDTVSDLGLGAKSLYLLAADSTPEAARQEVFERAVVGDRPTHAEVVAAVTAKKPKPQPKSEPAPEADEPPASVEAVPASLGERLGIAQKPETPAPRPAVKDTAVASRVDVATAAPPTKSDLGLEHLREVQAEHLERAAYWVGMDLPTDDKRVLHVSYVGSDRVKAMALAIRDHADLPESIRPLAEQLCDSHKVLFGGPRHQPNHDVPATDGGAEGPNGSGPPAAALPRGGAAA